MSIFNPVPEPPSDMQQLTRQLPIACRQSVYVFLINGSDVLGFANLYGVRKFLSEMGFVKTCYGECFHGWWLEKEMKAIHQENPDARFVIVGYEHGADTALSLAQAGAAMGAHVDMLMYLEPRGFSFDRVSAGEAGIGRVVVVHADKSLSAGAEIPGAETIAVSCSCRYTVTTHSATLNTLSQEVAKLAMSVPLPAPSVISDPFPPMLDDPAPTPRPLSTKKKTEISDQWDFLKSVSQPR